MAEVITIAILAGASIAGLVLMVPITWIVTSHRRKLEEMRMRHQVAVTEETRLAIEAVRKEVAALRDTTTEYDVSFDTALHRMESRMGNVEQRIQQIERAQEAQRLGSDQESYRAVQ